MAHVRLISRRRPAPAQFEPVLQFVGILSAIVQLIQQVAFTFGIDITLKGASPAE